MDIQQCLKIFCKQLPLHPAIFEEYLDKCDWLPSDKEAVLSTLAELLTFPKCAMAVAQCFPGILLDLLHRASSTVGNCSEEMPFSLVKHENFCSSLSELSKKFPVVIRFAMEYFKIHPPPFCRLVDKSYSVEQKFRKKKKKSNLGELSMLDDSEIVRICYNFLGLEYEYFSNLWNWSPFLHYLNNEDDTVKWFASLCVALLFKFSSEQTTAFLRNMFIKDEIIKFSVRYGASIGNETLLQEASHDMLSPLLQNQSSFDSSKSTNLMKAVVSIAGVLLPAYQQPQCNDGCLILTSSTYSNLHSLVLAVKKGLPVLLQGPMGCGKTALVEHLAQVTGRTEPPHLLKVQLGDQTDCKMLLGTYCCTDVPGEFLWQPGTLLQAVQNGYWLLLEDIDYAPMDVISVLVPLLETRLLTLPGHGIIRASSDFQLFATQRLMRGSSGFFKARSGRVDLLEKLFTKMFVQSLSEEELKQIITCKWPALSSVVDRITEMYLLVSNERVEPGFTNDTVLEETPVPTLLNESSYPFERRPVSTRDLMKWCSRMTNYLAESTDITALSAFREALDCFCFSISNSLQRIHLAEMIAARLNILKVKAEFYCDKYKPVIHTTPNEINIGRATLSRKTNEGSLFRNNRLTFAFTRQASILLEQIVVAIKNFEPVLLVGETGTGKTATVQYLAEETGNKLIVINMNQQSDSADLLGGFKPVDFKFVIRPLKEEYERIFVKTFSRSQNAAFLRNISTCYNQRRWKDLLSLMMHTRTAACHRLRDLETGKKTLLHRWLEIGERIGCLESQIKYSENALAFKFIEGSLVHALKEGSWILLDEINLASADTLECLSGLLESVHGSVVLLERGDIKTIERHPEFKLFACMNPATDVGKKELPSGLRNRFTEFFMEDLEDHSDLCVLVQHYLQGVALSKAQIEGIVAFYLHLRKVAMKNLADGTGHVPHYSLRTLCRALSYASGNPCKCIPRSLYEGFCLSFLTQLDSCSHPIVENLIIKYILEKQNVKSILHKQLPKPPGETHALFEGYWILKGDKEPVISDFYILTPSIRRNLKDLARIVAAGRHPVLLQGGTSVGKTSLIKWLADSSGNNCVRVNNHEHTDLQEYIGSYAADHSGKLIFKEGVLVDAMRNGYWVILDELNLAPTDVLEALNRVLDDNRELFIAETQEVVRAHPRFMLFATQNPPGEYGGRKVLSRAFRNRFIELHFEEIPSKELETILHKRCALPPSYCKKLVAVMIDLQTRRSSSGIFAGKHGLITLRDLFRWAERYRLASSQTAKFYDWDQHLADEGYLLLGGRVRKYEEAEIIANVIRKHFKCNVNPEKLFTFELSDASPVIQVVLERVKQFSSLSSEFGHVVWTFSMRRLAILVGQALRFNEPVLLVGETGCGKTTICQIFAELSDAPLYSVNCHMHSESADFLGGLRPVRNRDRDDNDEELNSSRLFEWVDGPLVKAMKDGALFLADEISLADDSVLERLNSVLEPERTLLMAEKGSDEKGYNLLITADNSFRFVATMNPGGDYGKKELSPALRNRFTEIWCPSYNSDEDIIRIIEHNLTAGIHLCNQQDGTTGIGCAMLDFLKWFSDQALGHRFTVSIRDILSWVHFINVATSSESDHSSPLDVPNAYVHGACLVLLDGLGTGNSGNFSAQQIQAAKVRSLQMLLNQIKRFADITLDEGTFGLYDTGAIAQLVTNDRVFGVEPFMIAKGPACCQKLDNIFSLKAPTSCMNALRVLRALQVTKPILLEGSPGVGKTTLVIALAKASGHNFVRINLSEQTDISDLFGADLPVEGGYGGQFAWHDGPLLRALKSGDWIVLDELNLASQSVLEGLNACLDHRGEIYVPELGRSFSAPKSAGRRIFACQNPLIQGGARKGLPKSFLNRFTQVYIESLSSSDLELITCTMYPQISTEIIHNIVSFNQKIHTEIVVNKSWGITGGPWDINLRDIFRWCDLLVASKGEKPGEYVSLIYASRMRNAADRARILKMCCETFGSAGISGSCHLSITSGWIQVGYSFLPRASRSCCGMSANRFLHGGDQLFLLPSQLQTLQSIMKCVEMNWMSILVGPPSSGKSRLVSLLAELTGNSLHILSMNSDMDTTELLGGFEQADLNRRLSQISNDVHSLVNSTVTKLLIFEKNVKSVQSLVESWARYETLQKIGRCGTTKDEAAHFLKKVTRLKETIQLLKHCQLSIANLSLLFEKLDILEKLVMQEEAVNCGGRFEWVDSLLVTALQNGYWLLIDNVNFCSPSVLDRLNGLLEPNGVLTISERGLCGEQMPTYKPHPNFRLFLSMDPRNGEISRAMRNRGVEIFLCTEEVNPTVRHLELKTLLDGVHLYSLAAQNLLIKIHDTITEDFVGGDKPSVNDLIHTAQLAVQRMQEGEHISVAIRESCMEIYVRCQNVITKKEKAKHVIEVVAGLQMELDQPSGFQSRSSIIHPSPLLAVKEFAFLPDLARTKQDCSLLFCLMHLSVCKTNTEIFSSDIQRFLCDMLNYEEIPSMENLLDSIFVALKMYVLGSSSSTWQLRIHFLKTLLSNKIGNVYKHDSSKGELNQLESLIMCTDNCASLMFNSEPAKNIFRKIAQLFDDNGITSEEVSFDLRWNPELLKHLIQKKLKPNANSSHVLEILFALSNRCNVLFEFLLWKASVEQKLQEFLTALKNKLFSKPLSVLHLSFALLKGIKGSHSVPIVLVDHLANFFSTLFEAIQKILASCNPFPDDILIKWKIALHWVERFWDVCSEPFSGNSLPSHHVTILYLHWMWLTKKAFPVFFGPSWNLDKLRVQPALWPIFEKLAGYFLKHIVHVNALSYKLHQIVGHPHPYRSLFEAELYDRLHRIWLKAIGGNSKNNQLTPVALFLNEGILRFREKIADVLLTRDNLMPNGQEVLNILEEQSVIHFNAGSDSQKESALHRQFLPVVEHMTLTQEQLCASLLVGKNRFDSIDVLSHIQVARNLACLSNFASPVHIAIIDELFKTSEGNPNDALLWEYQYEYLKSVWHCSLPEAMIQINSKHVGPAVLYTPFVNMVAAHILNDVCNSTSLLSSSVLMPSANVSLGSCSEMISHMQDVSNLLWNYAKSVNDVNYDPLLNDCSLFFAILLRLSSVLMEFADDRIQQKTNDDIHIMKNLNPRDLIQIADALPIIQRITTCISESGLLSSDLNKIWLQMTSNVINFLESRDFILQSPDDSTKMQSFVASSWICLGWLQTGLFLPIFDADPAVRRKMKLAFFKEQEHSASVELLLLNMQSRLITGQHLSSSVTCHLHPIIDIDQKCISDAKSAVISLESNQAVRPIPSQYEDLRDEMLQYLKTIGSSQHIFQILENLKKVKNLSLAKANKNFLEKVKGWISSQHSFLNKISSSYPWYRDLTLPVFVGILQMLHGMGLFVHFTKKDVQLASLGIKISDVGETLKMLSAFPSICDKYPSSFIMSKCLQSKTVKLVISSLFSSDDLKANANRHYLRVLKSSLLEIWNQSTTAGYLNNETLKFLHDTLQVFVKYWQQQEEERLSKEAEKESLYQYKGRDYGEILDEDAQLKESLKTAFPTYDEAFSDLIPSQSLEDQVCPAPHETNDDSLPASDISGYITQQEIEDIVSIHNKIFISYTTCNWHHLECSDHKADFLTPLIIRYPVIADILVHFGDILGKNVDASVINGHIIISSIYQRMLSISSDMALARNSNSSSYDFYHDSNITEVVHCHPILENFKKRIYELLQEWEDHPTLKQLVKIIDRILSFPATSPVMKFVTGFELLLAQAQDWEKNAHRGVSLCDHLEAVTKQIIIWRKLELSCWSSYLDLVECCASKQAAKWWFHVFGITESWLNSDSLEHQIQVCNTLQQFMEAAPLGEFRGRLDILLAFACHLVHIPSSSKQTTLVSVFWNLYQYYNQFLSAVSLKIQKLREPIGKEIKDFIKISRWNDINFWAVKESVDKSHRAIHKHIRKYEDCLKQLSHTAFCDSDLLSEPDVEVKSQMDLSDFKEKQIAWTLPNMNNELFNVSDSECSPNDVLQRISTLFRKSQKLCKKIIKQSSYSLHVTALDQFIGEVITTVHELQSLEANKDASKERQAVECKNINLRKRKALSNLFKALSDIGLSYRKGQLYSQTESNQTFDVIALPPLNCDAYYMNAKLSELDAVLLHVWKDCPQYFFRAVSRMASFQISMQNPSKEIGPSNLQRSLGFASHLLHICIEQRKDLCNVFNKMIHVRTMLQNVDISQPVIGSEGLLLPPQESFKQWVAVLLDYLAQALQGLGQFHELLMSCPSSSENAIINALVFDSTPDDISCLRKGDPLLVDAVSKVKTCVNIIKEVQESMSYEKFAVISDSPIIWTWESVQRTTLGFEKLKIAVDLLPSTYNGDKHVFLTFPCYLRNLISRKAEEYKTWAENNFKRCNEEVQMNDIKLKDSSLYKDQVRKASCVVVNRILVTIQKLFKNKESIMNVKKVPNAEEDTVEKSSENVSELEKGVLVNGLHVSLKSCLQMLDVDHIDASFTKLVYHWKAVTDSLLPISDINECTKFLLQALSLVKQYLNLVQFYFITLLKSHRVSSKMASVLLGIFTELVRKGFCLPAEFSDLTGGEGSTKFEDIEGGGIGEGDGIKDVSDRIENEDQLEEAHQESVEKKEQDATDGPDLKDEENGIEMSEDFIGKLHDLGDDNQEEENSENESDEENELDKQKGNLTAEDNTEKLDEQIWGDDKETSEDDSDDEKEEEYGPGDGPQEETRLVAKSDNKQHDKPDDSNTEEENDPKDDDKDNSMKINMMDEREFDDHPDPYYNKDNEKDGKQPENMDLAEDLKLDEEENINEGENEHEDEMDGGDQESENAEIKNNDEDDSQAINDKDQQMENEEQVGNNAEEEKEGSSDLNENDINPTEEENHELEAESNLQDSDELGKEPNEDTSVEEKACPSQDKSSQNAMAQPAKDCAKQSSSDMTESAQHSAAEESSSAINDNPSEETAGVGQAEANASEGHDGNKTKPKPQHKNSSEEPIKRSKTRPGLSNEKRTLGSVHEPYAKRLRTEDGHEEKDSSQEANKENSKENAATSDIFEHIKTAEMHYDSQVLDAATQEQVVEQSIPNEKDEAAEEELDPNDDVEPLEYEESKDDDTTQEKKANYSNINQQQDQKPVTKNANLLEDTDLTNECGITDGEQIKTAVVERGTESTIHTRVECWPDQDRPIDVEKLRQELEEQMSLWSVTSSSADGNENHSSKLEIQQAMETWHRYEEMTLQLAQDLCEKLRLILEPSLTSKLKGDYRTGKRLNMRKVIPYVASQFRKDKIWLRRTKPSKRDYQIMLAIDDSSSMADNHSKQLAFEALAVINKSLMLLEAGEVAIASFGEGVQLVHKFGEQFTDHTGATILREFTFQQKKTKVGLALDHAVSLMLDSRQLQRSGGTRGVEIAQLLIIVSDGRGVFSEGVNVIKQAVRRARDGGVFVVFVALDNPVNKDSIFDIRVPVFKGVGQLPEIKSYMDDFPFPFYLILRDINSLPAILSDALRQWFELVTSNER